MSNENKKTSGKPLSGALKIFYGVGDCGFTLMSNVESYYFNFFLTNLAKFGLGTVSMITTVASLVDACLSWMYGAILNSIKPKKWGRYRSWLVLIPWVVPFLYAFQFIKVGDGALSAIIIVIAAISSHICWNFAYVANVSMIAVAGKTPEDRAQLASTRAFWANLSKIIFSYVGAPLAAIFAGIIGETNQYGATAFVLGVIMAFLYFCHFKMFDGYEEVEVTTEAKKEDKTKTGAGDLVKSLLQNPPLLALMICDLAKFMFNFVCMGAAIYYFTYVANNAAFLPKYILISNILCVIAAYLFKTLAKAISARTTAIVTFVLMAVACIAAYLNFQNMMWVVVLMSVAQFGYGIAYAATPALYADTVVFAEWKTGKNAAGWISGLQNVPLKVAILTRGIIISAGLAMGNFSADIDPAAASMELKKGVCMAFIIIPAIALIIAAVVMLFGFRLTKDKVVQYQNEIAARKA